MRKFLTVNLTFCFGMVLSVLFCTAGRVSANQGVVNIGLNYPATGPYFKQGLDQKRASEIAVEEINSAGGILGKKIQLVMRDTRSNAKISAKNASDLYDIEGVPMILGGSSSAVAIATGEVALKKNKLFFATLSYSTETTGEYGHRHIFRECYDAFSAAKVMSEYLNKNFPGKKYFYITADYTWGWTTESSLRTFTGTKNMAEHPEILTELGAQDFGKALLEAKESKPDVLVLSLFGLDMEIALKQATEMGLKKTMQIIVPSLNEDMAQGAGPEAMENVIGTTPWMWSVPFKFNYSRGINFVKKFEEKYKRYPTTSGASAYVILHEYKAAVEQAKTFDTKAVITALEGRRYTGLKDDQYWRKWDHQSVQSVYAVKGRSAADVKKSKYQMDYFDIIASMKGEEAAVDYKEWSEIREMLNMETTLEEYVNAN